MMVVAVVMVLVVVFCFPFLHEYVFKSSVYFLSNAVK